MSYSKHHYIVVSSWNKTFLEASHQEAIRLFTKEMVSSITTSYVNHYLSFMISTDGSKQGWDDAINGARLRAKFRTFLKTLSYEDGSTPVMWSEIVMEDEGVPFVKHSYREHRS